MVANPTNDKWTADAYKQYEAEQDMKHEMVDGNVFAMVGGTRNHSRIATNLTVELDNQLRVTPCGVYNSDMCIKIDDASYVYPNVSVVCGEEAFEDDNQTSLLNPTVVIEVLSPSTENYDRGTKRDKYMSLPSLQSYLLVNTECLAIDLYTRQDDGWLLRQFMRLDLTIHLDTLDCNLSLSEIYRDIVFDS